MTGSGRPLPQRSGLAPRAVPPGLRVPGARTGTRTGRLSAGEPTARVLAQAFFVVAVPAFLLARGHAVMAGRSFFVLLACVLVRLAIVGRRDEFLCVLFSVLPFLNLLRGFLFYNAVSALLGGAVAYWFLMSRGAGAAFVRTHGLVLWIAAYFGAYYVLSWVTTGRYDVNLRAAECVLGATVVLILGRRRELLGTGLFGLMISACLLGLALVPHLEENERLGIVRLEGIGLGNPAQLGLPLALSLLSLVLDHGGWISPSRIRSLRLPLSLVPLTLLLLTTSRASWLVALIGIGCQFAFGRKGRGLVLVALVLGFITLKLVLASPTGAGLQAGLERTFSGERSPRNRTSGRSDQWIVAYNAFRESAGSMLFGHGAGLGPKIYARKSLETPNVEFEVGNEMALHSLYMQIAVELGLAGLLPFAVWIAIVGRRVIPWSRRTGYLLPTAGYLGYLAIAGTVSGNDTVSGAFLGLGLLGAAFAGPAASRVGGRSKSVGDPRGLPARPVWS